ncbi:hypothetical protein DFH06DRAFT_1127328 [Mycena polygramma]|nr:hypothetical protein DFH06DRAFT_1127328 [Mycena polygramma]
MGQISIPMWRSSNSFTKKAPPNRERVENKSLNTAHNIDHDASSRRGSAEIRFSDWRWFVRIKHRNWRGQFVQNLEEMVDSLGKKEMVKRENSLQDTQFWTPYYRAYALGDHRQRRYHVLRERPPSTVTSRARNLDMNTLGRNDYDSVLARLRALESLQTPPSLDAVMMRQDLRRQELEHHRKRETKRPATPKPYTRPRQGAHPRSRLVNYFSAEDVTDYQDAPTHASPECHDGDSTIILPYLASGELRRDPEMMGGCIAVVCPLPSLSLPMGRHANIVDIDVGDNVRGSTLTADRGVYFSSDGRRREEQLLNVAHKKRRVMGTERVDDYGEWIPVPEEGFADGEAEAQVIDAVSSVPGRKRKQYASSVRTWMSFPGSRSAGHLVRH